MHPDDRLAAPPRVDVGARGDTTADYRMLDDGGEVRRVRDMRTSIAGQDGRTLALGVLIEIGGEQPAGCHDTLTGLPNRVLMREHLTPGSKPWPRASSPTSSSAS